MAIVLLVEDEEQVRVLAQSYLDEQGHEVLSAGTPQGAIALLEKAPHVDVLFTDLDLKGASTLPPRTVLERLVVELAGPRSD